jgi:hypothetical protein
VKKGSVGDDPAFFHRKAQDYYMPARFRDNRGCGKWKSLSGIASFY